MKVFSVLLSAFLLSVVNGGSNKKGKCGPCLPEGCEPDKVLWCHTDKKGEETERCEKQSFDGHASKESKAMEWHPGCCGSCPDCSTLFPFPMYVALIKKNKPSSIDRCYRDICEPLFGDEGVTEIPFRRGGKKKGAKKGRARISTKDRCELDCCVYDCGERRGFFEDWEEEDGFRPPLDHGYYDFQSMCMGGCVGEFCTQEFGDEFFYRPCFRNRCRRMCRRRSTYWRSWWLHKEYEAMDNTLLPDPTFPPGIEDELFEMDCEYNCCREGCRYYKEQIARNECDDWCFRQHHKCGKPAP